MNSIVPRGSNFCCQDISGCLAGAEQGLRSLGIDFHFHQKPGSCSRDTEGRDIAYSFLQLLGNLSRTLDFIVSPSSRPRPQCFKTMFRILCLRPQTKLEFETASHTCIRSKLRYRDGPIRLSFAAYEICVMSCASLPFLSCLKSTSSSNMKHPVTARLLGLVVCLPSSRILT
jgi:hypothetical protein